MLRSKSSTLVSAPGWAWNDQDRDGINEEEEIDREGDKKRLENGAAGAATAAVLVRGQILSTCCTMLNVGWMSGNKTCPSPSTALTQWEDTSTSFVSICRVRLSLSIHS